MIAAILVLFFFALACYLIACTMRLEKQVPSTITQAKILRQLLLGDKEVKD